MDPGEVARGHAAVGQGVADAAAECVHRSDPPIAHGRPLAGPAPGMHAAPAGRPHEQDSAYQSQGERSISSTVSPSFNDSWTGRFPVKYSIMPLSFAEKVRSRSDLTMADRDAERAVRPKWRFARGTIWQNRGSGRGFSTWRGTPRLAVRSRSPFLELGHAVLEKGVRNRYRNRP